MREAQFAKLGCYLHFQFHQRANNRIRDRCVFAPAAKGHIIDDGLPTVGLSDDLPRSRVEPRVIRNQFCKFWNCGEFPAFTLEPTPKFAVRIL